MPIYSLGTSSNNSKKKKAPGPLHPTLQYNADVSLLSPRPRRLHPISSRIKKEERAEKTRYLTIVASPGGQQTTTSGGVIASPASKIAPQSIEKSSPVNDSMGALHQEALLSTGAHPRATSPSILDICRAGEEGQEIIPLLSLRRGMLHSCTLDSSCSPLDSLPDAMSSRTVADEFLVPLSRDSDHDERPLALTENVLCLWLGRFDLHRVVTAEMRFSVDDFIGVNRLPLMLPSVACLQLNGSNIPSVSNLGAHYSHLNTLWLNNCQLVTLNGLEQLSTSLKELHIAFNRVSDLSPLLSLCTSLEALDAEGNQIELVSSLPSVLTSLKKLHSLTLRGNPLEEYTDFSQRIVEAEKLKANENEAQITIVREQGWVNLPSEARTERENDWNNFFNTKSSVHLYRRWIQVVMPQLRYLDDMMLPSEAHIGEPRFFNMSPMRNTPVPNMDHAPDEKKKEKWRTESHLLVWKKGSIHSASSGPAYRGNESIAALKSERHLLHECLRDGGSNFVEQQLLEYSKNLRLRLSGPSVGGRHGNISLLNQCGGRFSNDSNSMSILWSPKGEPENPATFYEGEVFSGSAFLALRNNLLRRKREGRYRGGETSGWECRLFRVSATGSGERAKSFDTALQYEKEEEDKDGRFKEEMPQGNFFSVHSNHSSIELAKGLSQDRPRSDMAGRLGERTTTFRRDCREVKEENNVWLASTSSVFRGETQDDGDQAEFFKKELMRKRPQIPHEVVPASGEDLLSDFFSHQNNFEVVEVSKVEDIF